MKEHAAGYKYFKRLYMFYSCNNRGLIKKAYLKASFDIFTNSVSQVAQKLEQILQSASVRWSRSENVNFLNASASRISQIPIM